MPRKEWTLRWEKYPQREQLEAIPGMCTVICSCDNNEGIRIAISRIEGWLERSGYQIALLCPDAQLDENEAPVKKAMRGDETILYVPSACDDAIILRMSDKSVFDEISDTLNEDFGNDITWVVSVDHGTTNFKLDGIDGRGSRVVGILDGLEENHLSLYQFYEFWVGRKLVAKALVNHYNWEMGETEPSIEMFEVRKSWQGKGIARKLLEQIEKDARYEGFHKMWSSDDRLAMDFWVHMGYDMDLDEGMKWLDE